MYTQTENGRRHDPSNQAQTDDGQRLEREKNSDVEHHRVDSSPDGRSLQIQSSC